MIWARKTILIAGFGSFTLFLDNMSLLEGLSPLGSWLIGEEIQHILLKL